jgi:hypothetical protein
MIVTVALPFMSRLQPDALVAVTVYIPPASIVPKNSGVPVPL